MSIRLNPRAGRIGVFIPYHPKLDAYLEAVKRCFSGYDKLIAKDYDFTLVAQTDARNEGLQLCGDCDLVWCIDADEFITREDQSKIIKKMLTLDAYVGLCRVWNYLSEDTVLSPQTPHIPVVIANPRRIRFTDGRCVQLVRPYVFDDVNIHHFGFCYPREILDWKSEHYWNRSEPGEFRKLLNGGRARAELPPEIRELLKLARQRTLSTR